MTINIEKSEIIIFNKASRKLKRIFTIGNEALEVTHKYCYLGIEIKADGSFANSIKILSNKATKALGRLKRLFFNTQISVPILLRLFDTLISPILLYMQVKSGDHI